MLLTGISGAGKSTVGRLLASALGCVFVDLDERIVERAGMEVSAIFEKLGEARFRRWEAEALAEALNGPRAVIATGGGTLASDENRALALASASVVWLEVSVALAAARCAQSEERPLLTGGSAVDRLAELLERRRAAYSEAPVHVSSDGRAPIEVVDEILDALGLGGSAS